MKHRRNLLLLAFLLLLTCLLCACAPKELQGSFEGKYDLTNGSLSDSAYRISFYGDGRGTVYLSATAYTESFTYSASDGMIAVSFEGQDTLHIKYLFDSEENKLTLYTTDGQDSCTLSPVKE